MFKTKEIFNLLVLQSTFSVSQNLDAVSMRVLNTDFKINKINFSFQVFRYLEIQKIKDFLALRSKR